MRRGVGKREGGWELRKGEGEKRGNREEEKEEERRMERRREIRRIVRSGIDSLGEASGGGGMGRA